MLLHIGSILTNVKYITKKNVRYIKEKCQKIIKNFFTQWKTFYKWATWFYFASIKFIWTIPKYLGFNVPAFRFKMYLLWYYFLLLWWFEIFFYRNSTREDISVRNISTNIEIMSNVIMIAKKRETWSSRKRMIERPFLLGKILVSRIIGRYHSSCS